MRDIHQESHERERGFDELKDFARKAFDAGCRDESARSDL